MKAKPHNSVLNFILELQDLSIEGNSLLVT